MFYVTTRALDTNQPPSSFQCTTKLATPDDLEELFRELHRESPEGRYQLLVRKWYHERGFGDCYVTRATDTNEMCTVRWLVEPEHVRRLGWGNMVSLSEDEVMWENLYTLKRYRRNGARAAANIHIRRIAMQRGFKRIIGYNDLNNLPQRRWHEKTDTKVCAMILERHFLFRVTRKTLEYYDPPIAITALPSIKSK